jgi:hypothetical protein
VVNKMKAEAVRRVRVRQLFEARPSEDLTENAVMRFHGWLYQHHPELLPRRRGDMYKNLKVDLSGLFK